MVALVGCGSSSTHTTTVTNAPETTTTSAALTHEHFVAKLDDICKRATYQRPDNSRRGGLQVGAVHPQPELRQVKQIDGRSSGLETGARTLEASDGPLRELEQAGRGFVPEVK